MTQLDLWPNAKKSPGPRGARFGRIVSALWSALTDLAASWRWSWNRPAPKPTRKRHGTRPMLLDVYDACHALWAMGGRTIAKAWYCDRLARGDTDSRGRRWSTFRATLRLLGIPHETAEDEAGVTLHVSAMEAREVASKALPPVVGLPSETEERAHELAARDFGVYARLGVALVGGWSAVMAGKGGSL